MALKPTTKSKTSSKTTQAPKANSAPKGKGSGESHGIDRKLFNATMKQRGDDMAAARAKASGGFTKFPEEGTFYAKLVRIAGAPKDDYVWVTPMFEVVHGEYAGQEFAGDYCCNQTDKRAVGMWILADGLTGGNKPDDAEDLIDTYEDCVGNLYELNVVDNEQGFRNVKIVRPIDEVPDDA
jgi:hypothetical protein